VAELCRVFGVSRQAGHTWVERYPEGNHQLAAVAELSRRPKTSPHATSISPPASSIEYGARWTAATMRTPRSGLDRADRFRRAAGSTSELTSALRIARARACIAPADFASVDAVLDRVRAMLWRLTHGAASGGPGGAGPARRTDRERAALPAARHRPATPRAGRPSPGLAMGLRRVPAGCQAPSRAFHGDQRLRLPLTIRSAPNRAQALSRSWDRPRRRSSRTAWSRRGRRGPWRPARSPWRSRPRSG